MKKKYGQRAIENNKLESFANRYPDNDYVVNFECPEYTSLCPLSGFPDFATIYITYAPDKLCVELKSLKLYVNSFRTKPIFHEDVTNVILNDLVNLLHPKWVRADEFVIEGNLIHLQSKPTHFLPDHDDKALATKLTVIRIFTFKILEESFIEKVFSVLSDEYMPVNEKVTWLQNLCTLGKAEQLNPKP